MYFLAQFQTVQVKSVNSNDISMETPMKPLLFLTLLISVSLSHAEDKKNEWQATTLSEATIKNIQQSQINYKQCVGDEMQKKGYASIDARNATDAIIKRCETTLSKIRQAYLDAKVPSIIADRHLKKMRITITRRVLKQLMFAEAARRTMGQ